MSVDECPVSQSSAPSRARVLVVEDDRRLLQALATFLERAGFDVTTAADGVEALRAALHGFDGITTDLNMPHMDGHEFIQRPRELPIAPTPVLMLTAQLPDELPVDCAEPCYVMTKPCRLGELVEMLRLMMAMCSLDQLSCPTCPRCSRSPA